MPLLTAWFAAMLAAAPRLLFVLYYSGETWRGDLAGWRGMMVPLLCGSGLPVLDDNALPPQPVDRFCMQDDGHPTALFNRTIASALVEDFGRGAARCNAAVFSAADGARSVQDARDSSRYSAVSLSSG